VIEHWDLHIFLAIPVVRVFVFVLTTELASVPGQAFERSVVKIS